MRDKLFYFGLGLSALVIVLSVASVIPWVSVWPAAIVAGCLVLARWPGTLRKIRNASAWGILAWIVAQLSALGLAVGFDGETSEKIGVALIIAANILWVSVPLFLVSAVAAWRANRTK